MKNMKNKFFIAILTICILLFSMGCSTDLEVMAETKGDMETAISSERDQEEYTEGQDDYEELITAARECILKKDGKIPENYDFSIVLLTSGDYEIPGYMILDIDENGTDELIFGANGTEPGDTWDGIIYDIYTISNGELVHVLNGWERNRYYLCENGMIANEGSSGAANSNYAFFTFEGSKLHLVEAVIYDGIKDGDHPWFYSTESDYDAEKAEPISEERALEVRGKYVYQHPTFIPFVEAID